jgi:hypothetical protein
LGTFTQFELFILLRNIEDQQSADCSGYVEYDSRDEHVKRVLVFSLQLTIKRSAEQMS